MRIPTLLWDISHPEPGIYGVYHHVSEAHLHRYLAEFDFRYSNRVRLGIDDIERARRAIVGMGGKRLRYQRPASEAAQS